MESPFTFNSGWHESEKRIEFTAQLGRLWVKCRVVWVKCRVCETCVTQLETWVMLGVERKWTQCAVWPARSAQLRPMRFPLIRTSIRLSCDSCGFLISYLKFPVTSTHLCEAVSSLMINMSFYFHFCQWGKIVEILEIFSSQMCSKFLFDVVLNVCERPEVLF